MWVDGDASYRGKPNGSVEKPFTTIQAAVDAATPGTAIMVKAGDYVENVSIPRNVSGTDSAPIWLISADGPQAAHITAKSDTLATIGGGGTENFIVDGFHITGGKNGIQFSQNGNDYTDTIKNIVIKNNVIDNVVQDGVKANGGSNVVVTNNVITGGIDESIDFMSIIHGVISHNDVSGNTGTSAAIFAKGGSSDILISNNYVHGVTADGISVGGWTSYNYKMLDGYDAFQASDVTVVGNRVEDVGKRPLAFRGAVDSVATGNYLEAAQGYYTVVLVGNSAATKYGTFTSHDISVTDNFITRDTKTLFIEAGSDSVTFADNAVATITPATTGILGSLQDVLDKLSDEGTPAAPNVPETPSVPEAPAPPQVPSVPEAPGEPDASPPAGLGGKWAEGGETGSVAVNQGTDGNDLLIFKSGLLAGGLGDDKYIVSNIEAAKVVEKAGGGIDTIVATSRYMVMPDHSENLEMTRTEGAVGIGNAGDNIIRGNVGNDVLIGGAGHNLLTGGGGNDIFLVGKTDAVTRITDFSAGDIIHLAGDEFASFGALKGAMQQVGQDTVVTLSGGRQIILDNRDLNSLTAADFDMQDAGSASKGATATYKVSFDKQVNSFIGADTNDKMSGNGTAILRGGKGDDNYAINKVGDYIIEHANEGTDTVLLYRTSYAIDTNVENVIVNTKEATTVIGNSLANQIVGNRGNDVIVGGGGDDLLYGKGGADTFTFQSLGDGHDTIGDFEFRKDYIDVSDIRQDNPAVTFSTHLGPDGLDIIATLAGQSYTFATLAGVKKAYALDEILVG
ncbi:endo-1,3-1,4-beta-glycanase [Sphingobium indicum BiD32]|uniref:Endo-1,3-1,4-beta-glycanase n=2 Tax=Sphingobium indicum TaxID=332055 RepID=N1MNX2_9SPHN|nr:endo-1,3-1,4-beta-glycanase [Sphingobium indicum BiD32]